METGCSRNYITTYLSLRRDAPIATSWRADCYVVTHQKLRRDVISVAPGQVETLTRGVVTGGNKVTIKTLLIATRYSLIIRWLSLSVILVALDLRKIIFLSINSAFEVSWWNLVLHCASSYVSLSRYIRLRWLKDPTALAWRFDCAGLKIWLRCLEDSNS